MPWSPSQAFPHPLANIQASNVDASMTNYLSYVLVDMLTWQGLGDLINKFRVYTLGLEPIGLVSAPAMLMRMRIPHTYCWSPALIPKPADWGNHISISGFFFLNLASNFTPDADLARFLDSGPPPVYIGFGSIVIDDPNAMTDLIFEAVRKTGQRALVSKGWGGLGSDEMAAPDGVYMLGNVPHDWLFQKVSAVVHHGGAGTTAAGIAAGKPTVIVPFFGDQPFWGAMVHKAGAGPEPIPHKKLNADNLAAAITEALTPASKERAKELRDKISQEKGTDNGGLYFHQMLDVDKLRCSLLPERAAVWRVKRTNIRLSALAAYILAEKEIVSFSDLKLYRAKEYAPDEGPWDPITGGSGALMGTIGSMMMGIADLPLETLKALKIHPETAKIKKNSLNKDGTEEPAEPSQAASSTGKLKKKNPSRQPTDELAEPPQVASSTAPPSTLYGDSSTPTNTSQASLPSLSSTSSLTSPTRVNMIKRRPLRDGATISRTTSSSSIPLEQQVGDSSEQLSSQRLPEASTSQLSTPSASTSTGSAMAEALRNLPEGSRPRSRGRSPSGQLGAEPTSDRPAHGRTLSSSSPWQIGTSIDTAVGTSKGFGKIIGAGLKAPMDVTLAMSRGFHNIPKLYGEEVRQVDRVTGIQSGLKAAGKEFGIGIYEGITGLVTQPYSGAKKEGTKGFFKGMGKGIAGVQFKPSAAALALPAYALQGLYKEYQKHFGIGVNNYIVAARTAQGWDEWKTAPLEQKKEVVHLYLALLKETMARKSKKRGGDTDRVEEAVGNFIEKRKQARRERFARVTKTGKKKSYQVGELLEAEPDSVAELPTDIPSTAADPHASARSASFGTIRSDSTSSATSQPTPMSPPLGRTFSYPDSDDDEDTVIDPQSPPPLPRRADVPHDPEMEAAIRASIQETSRGNAHEDELINQAIRASLTELQRLQTIEREEEREEQHELRRAIAQSRSTEALPTHADISSAQVQAAQEAEDDLYGHSDEPLPDYDAPGWLGEQEGGILRDEKSAAGPPEPQPQRTAAAPGPSAGIPVIQAESSDGEDEELRRAIEQSKEMHEEMERGRQEEQIVMEYVKRASLAEQEFRRKMEATANADQGSGGPGGEPSIQAGTIHTDL